MHSMPSFMPPSRHQSCFPENFQSSPTPPKDELLMEPAALCILYQNCLQNTFFLCASCRCAPSFFRQPAHFHAVPLERMPHHLNTRCLR